MKVILTSKGFENKLVFNKIMNLINIDIKEIRMLVIPTARKNEYKKEKYIKDYKAVIGGHYPKATSSKARCVDCCYRNICEK